MADEITGEILADGTIKSTTGVVSGENHQNAEAFMKMLAGLTGGAVKRDRRGDVEQHRHAHHHGHSHEH